MNDIQKLNDKDLENLKNRKSFTDNKKAFLEPRVTNLEAFVKDLSNEFKILNTDLNELKKPQTTLDTQKIYIGHNKGESPKSLGGTLMFSGAIQSPHQLEDFLSERINFEAAAKTNFND